MLGECCDHASFQLQYLVRGVRFTHRIARSGKYTARTRSGALQKANFWNKLLEYKAIAVRSVDASQEKIKR